MELLNPRGYLSVFWLVVALTAALCLAKKTPKLEKIIESRPEDCNDVAEPGDTVIVHYTGQLESGQVFDTSRKAGREPFSVQLGAGQVIQGWDDGLIGMCVGEIRKLIIPPHLAYGDKGVQGVIPGGATLLFEVELLELTKAPVVRMPEGRGFWTALGVAAVLALLGYELYRRAGKEQKEAKKTKKGREHPVTKKGQSKKKK